MESEEEKLGRFIVVGVDGSEPSKAALKWAAQQAQLTHAELIAVTAWEMPINYGWTAIYLPDIDLHHDSQLTLERTVKEALGDHEGLAMRIFVKEGHPAVVLLRMSAKADLLVLGSRGRGAFTGMLLGSVSDHCVHHAACPVVIVRDGRS